MSIYCTQRPCPADAPSHPTLMAILCSNPPVPSGSYMSSPSFPTPPPHALGLKPHRSGQHAPAQPSRPPTHPPSIPPPQVPLGGPAGLPQSLQHAAPGYQQVRCMPSVCIVQPRMCSAGSCLYALT